MKDTNLLMFHRRLVNSLYSRNITSFLLFPTGQIFKSWRNFTASISLLLVTMTFFFLTSLNVWEKFNLPVQLKDAHTNRAELLTLLAASCAILALIADRYLDKYHRGPAFVLSVTVGCTAALHYLTAKDYYVLALILLPLIAVGTMLSGSWRRPINSEERLTWIFRPLWDWHLRCIITHLGY